VLAVVADPLARQAGADAQSYLPIVSWPQPNTWGRRLQRETGPWTFPAEAGTLEDPGEWQTCTSARQKARTATVARRRSGSGMGRWTPAELAGQVRAMAAGGPGPPCRIRASAWIAGTYSKRPTGRPSGGSGAAIARLEDPAVRRVQLAQRRRGRAGDGRPSGVLSRGLDWQVRDVEAPALRQLKTLRRASPSAPRRRPSWRRSGFPRTALSRRGREDARSEGLEVRPWGRIAQDGRRVRGRLPPGRHRIIVFLRTRASNPSPLDSGSGSFVDYLNPAATRRFMRLTHAQVPAPLRPALREDHPGPLHRRAASHGRGPFPWTPGSPGASGSSGATTCFRTSWRWWTTAIPADGAPRRVLADRAELVEAGFFAPIARWCRRNGHRAHRHVYDEHIGAWPAAPHLMNWLRRFDWPGIDALGERAGPASARWPPRGAPRGQAALRVRGAGLAGGWNATLAMAKRGYNFLALMGVDVLVPMRFTRRSRTRAWSARRATSSRTPTGSTTGPSPP